MKVIGVTGWKNSGKTGLVERLVAELTGRGLVVSTIKHAHHAADVDHEGTDTFRHRAAGAKQVILASPMRWAKMTELRGDHEPELAHYLDQIDHADIVVVEGFKRSNHPKIEAYRAENGTSLIAPESDSIIAVAAKGQVDTDLPVLDLDDTASIADFILRFHGMAGNAAPSKGLRNDCFALPSGVEWVPVDAALARLQSGLGVVAQEETIAVNAALGRILAQDVRAGRANPPAANSAVDGYGLAHAALGDGINTLPLIDGRAAAGGPFTGVVPRGQAIRILTGAIVPEGVDAVVMEEDVTLGDGQITFDGLPKAGANIRKAGEDVSAGDVVIPAGHRLRAGDMALLAAVGSDQVSVRRPLRVGVLSTGDELCERPEPDLPAHKTYDANRPLLLGLAKTWGYEAVDMGLAPDNADLIETRLDDFADKVDVILTSGGASAGDEDHVSRLLREKGSLSSWRIAIKPGRPLALAMWQGVPVFGLPGNPVAAFVCSLVFARPALSLMSGKGWETPVGFNVPAAFTKSKKAGRREYLRARLTPDGRAEVFKSEGSGRISGLVWADGLVELPDKAAEISRGDPVRYIPYSSFGIVI